MATPMDIDDQHSDERDGANPINRYSWYWAVLAAVVVILALVLMALPTQPVQ